MAIGFDAIEGRFSELRDFVLHDLDLLLASPCGGNYAAALVITTACEALGQLRYESGAGTKFFGEYILPETWRPVSASLFNALRNGLAHRFAPKVVFRVASVPVELGISWKGQPHLRFVEGEGCVYLNLNIAAMAESLAKGFTAYESELREDAGLRDRFESRWNREREVAVQSDPERQVWSQLLSQDSASRPSRYRPGENALV